jgi:hypothetical protein
MPRFLQRIISDAGDGWQLVEQVPEVQPAQLIVHSLEIREPEPGEGYQDFISWHGVRYFTASEVTLFRREARHVEPPRPMWRNIIPALRICDLLREELGHPLVVGNGFRDSAYNAQVGGRPSSRHLYNQAIDLDLPSGHRGPAARCEFADAIGRLWHEHADELRMGVGFYQYEPTRAHIDTGYRARFWERQFAWPILQRTKSP